MQHLNPSSSIKLRVYDNSYLTALEQYVLPNEQAIYTTLPINAMKQCELVKGAIPIIIVKEDELVGFFVLDHNQSANLYTNNKDAVIFKSFSIDQRHQGLKYAKSSLRLLTSLTKKLFPTKNEILLTVHHTNNPAINLYKKCGFVDKEIRYSGEYGEELVLHKEV